MSHARALYLHGLVEENNDHDGETQRNDEVAPPTPKFAAQWLRRFRRDSVASFSVRLHVVASESILFIPRRSASRHWALAQTRSCSIPVPKNTKRNGPAASADPCHLGFVAAARFFWASGSSWIKLKVATRHWNWAAHLFEMRLAFPTVLEAWRETLYLQTSCNISLTGGRTKFILAFLLANQLQLEMQRFFQIDSS